MGIISNIEKASVSRLAVYTAISATVSIACIIISNIYDTSSDKFITLYITVAGIIWSGMFGLGAFLKFTSGK